MVMLYISRRIVCFILGDEAMEPLTATFHVISPFPVNHSKYLVFIYSAPFASVHLKPFTKTSSKLQRLGYPIRGNTK